MKPAPTENTSTFTDLALRPELLQALSGLGYEEPTPIQREAIPSLLQGRDLLGQAATGTGKTATFALPILDRLRREGGRTQPVALVLVPTRELAVQVSEAMHRYGRNLDARVLPLYGGQPIGRQLRALDQGVDVVFATPGRALDHIARGTLRLGSLVTVVSGRKAAKCERSCTGSPRWAAVIIVVPGVALGVLVGRRVVALLVDALGIVPGADVRTIGIAAIVAATLLVANTLALLPARRAAQVRMGDLSADR